MNTISPRILVCLGVLSAIFAGCGDDDRGGGDAGADADGINDLDGDADSDADGDSDADADSDADGDADGDTDGDTDADSDSDDGLACDDAAILTGIVHGPNGYIPISGALVYVANGTPEGIPDHVYCDECVEFTPQDEYTFTAADGTFSLQACPAPGRKLVVRKGQFMRVSDYDVEAGSASLPASLTDLPGAWNPAAGEYIPKIAVANGSYDRIEDALGKIGLGQTMIESFEELLAPGTESFDLYDNGESPTVDGFVSAGTMQDLVTDPARLAQYHIIFVPCTSSTWESLSTNPTVQQNIQNWVAAGGRWYVADWSNEWFRHIFPQYQTFAMSLGDADLGSYDSLATVEDEGLRDWLRALPEGAPGHLTDINPLNDDGPTGHPTLGLVDATPPQVLTVDNWSGILSTNQVFVEDDEGNMVDVGHKVWLRGPGGTSPINGQNIPLTVSGQYGCGKIQFTSYHAAEFENYVGLSPQELVLLYTILELGVCQIDLPPPPPVG